MSKTRFWCGVAITLMGAVVASALPCWPCVSHQRTTFYFSFREDPPAQKIAGHCWHCGDRHLVSLWSRYWPAWADEDEE